MWFLWSCHTATGELIWFNWKIDMITLLQSEGFHFYLRQWLDIKQAFSPSVHCTPWILDTWINEQLFFAFFFLNLVLVKVCVRACRGAEGCGLLMELFAACVRFSVCLAASGLFGELSNIVQRTPYATGLPEYGSNNVFGDLIWLGPTGAWLGTEERKIFYTHKNKLRALWSSLLCNHFSPDTFMLWWVLMMIEMMATICKKHRFVWTHTHTYTHTLVFLYVWGPSVDVIINTVN